MSATSTSSAKPSLSFQSDKITDLYLQTRTLVYVRQSTQQQVLEKRVSTSRQYALVDRAVALQCVLKVDVRLPR